MEWSEGAIFSFASGIKISCAGPACNQRAKMASYVFSGKESTIMLFRVPYCCHLYAARNKEATCLFYADSKYSIFSMLESTITYNKGPNLDKALQT